MNNPKHILLFDGVCNLCNSLVKFIISKDKNSIIRFASLQSASGKSILLKAGLKNDTIDTVVYLSGEKLYLRSSAILNLLKDIGGGWRIFYSMIIIPSFIRDFLYNTIAGNRYRIFGKRETCMIPSEDLESRFII